MKILCVGEMLADILVYPVHKVMLQNDTSPVERIQFSSGGDANNNAVNLSKLGHDVVYMGRIGCDEMGRFVEQQAKEAGIDMRYAVHSKTAGQGMSLILTDPNGNRTFLQYAGTSDEFSFDDCDLTILDEVDLLQISGVFHMPKFDGEGAANLLAEAKKRHVVTSMDITTDRSGKWKGILDPCYPYLDYFLPSIEQASMVSGERSLEKIAEFFLRNGVKNVAIKNGSAGSYFQNKDTAFYAGTYSDIKAVETTGAGDAFCAGFLTGVGMGGTPIQCVTWGTACASFVIQAFGATSGMRSQREIQRFIDSRPPLQIRYLFDRT